MQFDRLQKKGSFEAPFLLRRRCLHPGSFQQRIARGGWAAVGFIGVQHFPRFVEFEHGRLRLASTHKLAIHTAKQLRSR